MAKLTLFGLLAAFLLSPAASAQSNFDGTWKMDLSTVQFPTKPDTYLLQNGTWECKTCIPPISVKADGQDHAVTGHPYYDSINIKVVDNNTIVETDKRNGKTVTVGRYSVSADGKTLSIEFTDSSNSNAQPVTGKGSAVRVADGPAGSHAVSGSWRTTKLENLSANALTITLKVEGDSLHLTNQTGQSYTAKLDGTDAPFSGDPGVTSVSVKRIDKNTIEETDKRDGKPISVVRMTLSADAKSMAIVSHDVRADTTTRLTVTKQ